MKNKKQIIALGVLIISILVICISVTYAYFSVGMTTKNEKFGLQTGTMELVFSDGNAGIKDTMSFGKTVTKKFVIENTGTLEASLALNWKNFINTYTDGSLSYNLKYAEEENGTYKELIPETNMPVSDVAINQTLMSEISVPAGDTYYYDLNITFNNLSIDQTKDIEATFTTEFDVGVPERFIHYTLRVDPNGGEWETFSAPQEYKLMNNDTMEIPNPTRVGYTFGGWDLTGESSELTGTTFNMGIEDATLTAKWTAKKITVTVDGTSREVDFGTTIDLGIPEREGYTFTGWETTGGTLENNALKVDEDKELTVTSTYVINKYKYIVYHNQMNTDGVGYTLVSADTKEGELEYNSQVTPEVKTYTGFTSPSTQSLTIQAETVYPPVKNKLEYNYTRNKYTVTYNVDGVTSTEEMYYGASKDLGTREKTGYDFTNWSATSGTMSGNTFTLSDSNSTVTANFTPKTFSVTFNANGGTVTNQSTTVTYDSTYGELPTPTRDGFVFAGWYTDQTDGTEVTSSTKVDLSADQTLFAHWKNTVTVTFNVNGGTSSTVDTATYIVGEPYGTLPTATTNLGVFAGWFTKASGGTQVTTSSIVPNNDHTLYAQWSGCFTEETLLYTPTGYKRIIDIKKDDEVYSYNLETKELEISNVENVMVHEVTEYLKITLEDETSFNVTSTHPFYDKKTNTWKEIGEFKIGETLMNKDRKEVKIVDKSNISEVQKVYNLEVSGNHNYFVTDSNILVHNKGWAV